MVRAFKLYTGADNASHVLEGTIDEKARTDVIAIHFKETPAHSSYDWHPDPEPQFVITLSGTLEFATPDGETFVVRPGDVLPETIVNRLNQLTNRVLQSPEIEANLAKFGAKQRSGSPQDLAALWKRETQKWSKIISAAGIKAD